MRSVTAAGGSGRAGTDSNSLRCPPPRRRVVDGAGDQHVANPPFTDTQIRPLEDLRRPGGHRDRERAAVQGAANPKRGADRVAGAADGHGRDPARHLELPTDVQPVFDAIAAARCGCATGRIGALFGFDGELVHQVAAPQLHARGVARSAVRTFPMRPTRARMPGRAILSGAVGHIADVERSRSYGRALQRAHRLSKPTGGADGP